MAQHTPKVWLFSKSVDLLVLGAPVWATWVVCFILPKEILAMQLPLWAWVVFIIGIDVSHVWSTLFRTYLDKEEFNNHRPLLIAAPLLCFSFFYLLASVSTAAFWTVLAYLALYHFIKQQYGFTRLYQAKYGPQAKKFFKDTMITYFAMLYPVVYWHFNSDRNFEWFVTGDFINWRQYIEGGLGTWASSANMAGNAIFWLVIAAWLAEEVYLAKRFGKPCPWGKWLWVLTTAANWFLGIVYFNSDIAFSLTNVVAHGVPYLWLVWFYVDKKRAIKQPKPRHWQTAAWRASLMLAIVLVLAFGEEYLWDMFLYRDNEAFFGSVARYPFAALDHPLWQATALAMLSLPQTTHYVLDGFIWKGNAKNPYLKQVIMT